MQCQYFGICGSCSLGGKTYEEQLKEKLDVQKERFSCLHSGDFDVIQSLDGAFRNRAEFRIWRTFYDDGEPKVDYAMNNLEKKPFVIDSCSIVSDSINSVMPKLLEKIKSSEALNYKLFAAEFLSATTGDMLVTLIYHKKLDESWKEEALKIEQELSIKVIGRSRKQKLIVSSDHIEDSLQIDGKQYTFHYFEGGFTQPNQKVNTQMIEWVIQNSTHQNDLCELYCGGGNFTIPLSNYFQRVLATEISKTSIKSAKLNCELNGISNIDFIRMSSEEFVEAKNKVREFTRLKRENVNLDDYNFGTIFVDPPRAGLDETTTTLCSEFDQIIYISCNPETLKRDLDELTKTHTIKKFAFFDQFAYSHHIESGVILEKNNCMKYIGIDLAWNPKNSSGVALLEDDTLLEVHNFYSLEEILDFVNLYPDAQVAVDAPLYIPNETGNREIEKEFLKEYAKYKLGVYPVSRSLLLKNNSIIAGEELTSNISQKLGEDLFEVYPHVTIMNCFHGSVLPYKRKKGRDTNFIRLQLKILQNYLSKYIQGDFSIDIDSLKGQKLKYYEDRLDAVVCAYTLYHCSANDYQLYGGIFKVPTRKLT